MTNLYKIFKKLNKDESYTYSYEQLNNKPSGYQELIKEQKLQGSRQLLFNSELMIEIIRWTINFNESIHVTDVEVDHDDDQSMELEIYRLIQASINDYEKEVGNLIKILDWCVDSNSIDIKSVSIRNITNNDACKIYFDGTFSGTELLFVGFIKPFLEANG